VKWAELEASIYRITMRLATRNGEQVKNTASSYMSENWPPLYLNSALNNILPMTIKYPLRYIHPVENDLIRRIDSVHCKATWTLSIQKLSSMWQWLPISIPIIILNFPHRNEWFIWHSHSERRRRKVQNQQCLICKRMLRLAKEENVVGSFVRRNSFTNRKKVPLKQAWCQALKKFTPCLRCLYISTTIFLLIIYETMRATNACFDVRPRHTLVLGTGARRMGRNRQFVFLFCFSETGAELAWCLVNGEHMHNRRRNRLGIMYHRCHLSCSAFWQNSIIKGKSK